MQEEQPSPKESFDEARDQRAHDLERSSDAAREKIEKIQQDAAQKRAEMRREHAANWDEKLDAEKARLLRDPPAPHFTPTGRSEHLDADAVKDKELTRRATRNIEQAYARDERMAYVQEEVEITAAIEADLQRAGLVGEVQLQTAENTPAPEHSASGPAPDRTDEAGLIPIFYRSSIERENGGHER